MVRKKKRKKVLFKVFQTKRSFKKELKRQIRLALVAAIGFLIAFAWRDAVYNTSFKLVDKITNATNFALSEFYTAIFITILGVFLLIITSKFLREKR